MLLPYPSKGSSACRARASAPQQLCALRGQPAMSLCCGGGGGGEDDGVDPEEAKRDRELNKGQRKEINPK